MLENNLLKSNFLGRDGFRWWIGQIASEDAQGDQINEIGTAWGNFGDSTNRPTIFFYFNGYAYFGGANYGQVMHSSLESGTNILISLIYRHG